MKPAGKRPERYGLHVVPDFETESKAKPRQGFLPKRPATQIWESPAFQSLLGHRDAIETESELQAKRAQLEVLMKRVAKEYKVPLSGVKQMTKEWDKAGYFDMAADDDMSVGDWYDSKSDSDMEVEAPPAPKPPPPPGGAGRIPARDVEMRPEPEAFASGSGGQPPGGPPPGAGRVPAKDVDMEDGVPASSSRPPPPPPGDSVRNLINFMREERQGKRPNPVIDVDGPPRPPQPPGPPAPPAPPAPGLIQNHRMATEQLRQLAEENRQHRDRILLLEQEKLAAAISQSMAEKQRQEELRALHAAVQGATNAASSAASAATIAASQAAQGNNVAQQFLQQMHSNLAAADSGRASMEATPVETKAKRRVIRPYVGTGRGVKRPGEDFPPFQRRPRPEFAIASRNSPPPPPPPPPAAAAIAVAREAKRAAAPDLSVTEAKRLAPYADITGSIENILGNMALEIIEKNRANPKVEQFEDDLNKRNDESGAARAPGRFLKYAKHLMKKKAEVKARRKAEEKKTPSKAKPEPEEPKKSKVKRDVGVVKAKTEVVKMTPGGRSTRV